MPPDERSAVVWRLGDALLAVDVDDVVEIAPAADGAESRLGTIGFHQIPGLASRQAGRAVVVRRGDEPLALPADAVEGVTTYDPAENASTPDWLRDVPAVHLAGLIRLPDRRLAALLVPQGLP